MELGVSYEPLFLGDLFISRIHLVGAGVAIALFVGFMVFFRSRTGIKLRAIADDYMASWSVGISVERGVGLSWALASVVAVAAGVIWGEIQGVDQALSLLLLKGLTVAVLGGLDSILGAVIMASSSVSWKMWAPTSSIRLSEAEAGNSSSPPCSYLQ